MKKYLLVLICLFFLITRLYKIGEIPVSVYWDEASIGYNAYSIAETGTDEWGEVFPVHFRAFGEFKLPVYIYATALSIKLFGLNEFAVRLPAVLFSLGVVIIIYFLARRLSGSATMGLLASFFFSVSPWYFIFSRTGYEATAGLMFYLLALYLFLEHNRNRWYLLLSTVSFIFSAYSYNSFRLLIPITILILFLYEMRNLKAFIKVNSIPLTLSVIFLTISIIPIYRLYVYDAGISRFQAVGTTSSTFIQNYLSHFSPDFLILRGDKNLRSQQAGFGQLYLPELILLPLGFLYMVKSKSKYRLLPLALLLLGSIPAALTKESPHALRAISMVPFISIISAVGIATLCQLTRKKNYIILTVIIIFLAFFANYFRSFLNTYPAKSVTDWQYEYKKIYTDFGDRFDKYNRILISDKYAQPYIFALFYLKYDPKSFRQEVIRNSVDQWGFSTVQKFGKFEFGKSPELIIFER
ncbi:MAG: glycosyltransferase family 39 protein [Candidatus Daviesbacteria bacterium]|nr:glycosyltransferase family 39 protein [Candidatus Daviesbacteria bacterium]